MGSGGHKVQDPIKPDAEQAAIAVTLAAEQALLDLEQAKIVALQAETLSIAGEARALSSSLLTVTDGTAFSLFTIPIALNTAISLILRYCYGGSDGTDTQVESGTIHINSVNKAGTLTTVLTIVSDNGLAASSGTLAITIAAAEGVANVLLVQGTFDSSLTLTSNFLSYNVQVLHAADPTITVVNADT
jgi:hypothetical protein